MSFFDILKHKQQTETDSDYRAYIKRLDTLSDDKTEDKRLEGLMSKLDIKPEDAAIDYQRVKTARKLADNASMIGMRQSEWEDAKAEQEQAKTAYDIEVEKMKQRVTDADKAERNTRKQLKQCHQALLELRELPPNMIEALGVDIR